jgi:hypothetical protein
VNETWETSGWNSKAENQTRPQSQPQIQSSTPIVQNFNYNSPEESVAPVEQQKKQSPLAKLSPPERLAENSSPQIGRPSPLNKKIKPGPQQKPCITDFCGLKKPSLDGLWVAQDGEMLGVKNNRYLWSDSKSRYLTGQLKVQNEYLIANVDGHDQLMRFKYKLSGNRLLTMQPDGKVREFVRASANQYNGVYPDYGQNYGNYYSQ